MQNRHWGRSGIRKLELFQLTLIMLSTSTVLVVSGMHLAGSVLAGGLVAFVPSLLFARKLLKYQGAGAAKQILRAFYLGEAIKLALSILLFALVFIFFKVNALAFFLTYIAVIMTHWLSPLFIMNQQYRPKK